MVNKSTIFGFTTGVITFVAVVGFGIPGIVGVGAGITTAAITKVAAARVFHEGEAKAPEHEPAREERLKKINELEAKYREETPRLEEIPVGFFRELSHDLKLKIAYKALRDHGLGGALVTAVNRKLGNGEISTKEHLIAFIGEVVRKISQVDVWHSNGEITPEQAEEAKNGLKNGDERLYQKYLELIKSR